jgi:hypothetical protein
MGATAGQDYDDTAGGTTPALELELANRTEQWREALRLLSAAESRCDALEQALLEHQCESIDNSSVAHHDAGIDWERLRPMPPGFWS